jgi:hypothetical protein
VRHRTQLIAEGVFPPAQIEEAIYEIVQSLLSNAPLTLIVSKEAIRRLTVRDVPDGDDLVHRIYSSGDFRAGADAFVNRTKPHWRGE